MLSVISSLRFSGRAPVRSMVSRTWLDKVRLPELAGAHIHRDGDGTDPGAAGPRRRLPACLFQNHASQGNDQPCFLRHRNEFHRPQHAAPGMIPAQQRLRSDDAPAIHLGLIPERKLMVADAHARISSSRQARAFTAACSAGAKKRIAFRPAAFAWYMAMSACCRICVPFSFP